VADQSATWRSGTNTNLNLTASSSQPLDQPQASPTPVATQTAIMQNSPTRTPSSHETAQSPAKTAPASPGIPGTSQPSSVATGALQTAVTLTVPLQATAISTEPAQPASAATEAVQPPAATSDLSQPSSASTPNATAQDSGGGLLWVAIVALLIVAGAAYLFWTMRKKK